ncbi:MAG: Lrp/AsnC ligand binding domain-containing protein [Actinomycetota bacterium]|nr:Lrp/AsnC ligand binding domain-containing protein [Actinomycetota bacterium]
MKKKAYVLIKVSAGKLDKVMRTLSSMPEVESVEGVSGHCDVVAIISGPNLETLQNTILSTVRGTDGIESTETWIVMVPQPESWLTEEFESYIGDLDDAELAAIRVLAEKDRGVMIQELIDEISRRLGDKSYDIHNLTVTIKNLKLKAREKYRRESLIDFDYDMGYFINEAYIESLRNILGIEPGLDSK